ncbi:MAG: acyltransferase, partial [Acidobacteria bacterium]|nr:acyltransferase [Acidobacteriota bacterium]
MKRGNNFDLARLLLATLVVFFHAAMLSEHPRLLFLHRLDARGAVEGFFVISGFLIFASYERSRSLRDYFVKRARRILPGYWFATLLCLAIAAGYGRLFRAGKFLIGNLTFLGFISPGIPGVFESNPENAAMNGALWTIKIEVLFYCAVPVLVFLCRRFRPILVLSACIAASLAWRAALARHSSLSLQLPGQLSYFSLGALAYYYRPAFHRIAKWIWAPALLLYI